MSTQLEIYSLFLPPLQIVGPPMQWLEKRTVHSYKVHFLGFSEFPKLTSALFTGSLGLYLILYLLTVCWNVGLITLIKTDAHLHTPMYFFLSKLSLLDICYASTIAPKMLSDFFWKCKFISIWACITAWVSSLGLSECSLLAAIAYDCYMAICNPFLYMAIMSLHSV